MLEAWFKDSQDNLFGVLDTIPLNEPASRDRVNLMITLVRKLKTSLEQFVQDGEFSEKEWRDLLELNKKGLLGGLLGR